MALRHKALLTLAVLGGLACPLAAVEAVGKPSFDRVSLLT